MRSGFFAVAVGACALFAGLGAGVSKAEAACVRGVASWDVLWMRSGPNVRYSRVGSIPYDGCGVRIYWDSCAGAWCRVWYRGVSGWAHTRYLG